MFIEVEKPFIANENQIKNLIEGATLQESDEVHIDRYYDTIDYSLARKLMFLRKRNKGYELKVPQQKVSSEKKCVRLYEEFHSDGEIYQYLDIFPRGSLEEDLLENGYRLIAEYTTFRTTYKRGEFNICLDETDFGIKIVEIELIVEDPAEINEATNKIIKLAHDCRLDQPLKTGKLVEYLKRYNQKCWQIVIDAGISLE